MGDKKPNSNPSIDLNDDDSDIEIMGYFSPKNFNSQAQNQNKLAYSIPPKASYSQQYFNQKNEQFELSPKPLTQKYQQQNFPKYSQAIQNPPNFRIQETKQDPRFSNFNQSTNLPSFTKASDAYNNQKTSDFLQMIQPKEKIKNKSTEVSNSEFSQLRVSANNSLSIPLHPSITVPKFYRFDVCNTEVRFPFEKPYIAQQQIMTTSIKAFLKGQNALLESPTGTGKSLALLAAALAYQESHPQIVRIFYTSRTHMQLKQLVDEFKKLAYFPRFGILASRTHLCLIPGVYKSANPNAACRDLCNSEEGCPYYRKPNTETNVSDDIEDTDFKPSDPSKKKFGKTTNSTVAVPVDFTSQGQKPKFDIDDLKEYGRKNQLCPYQLAFSIYQGCQLVLCPYNYIFKANDDNNLLCDLAKNTAIVIFDEGHNIEDTARESCSLTFNLHQVVQTLQDAETAPADSSYKTLFDHMRQIATDILTFLKAKREEYDDLKKDKRPKYLKADSFFQVFRHMNPKEIWSLGTQMQNYVKYITTYGIEEKNEFFTETLLSFCDACQDVFSILRDDKFDAFRIVFVPDENNHPERDQFRLICMRPGVLFEPINVHALSVIIASGTLSPLDSFSSELEATFPFRISAPHVVDPSQALAMSIVSNHKGVRITSKFSVLQADKNSVFDAVGDVLIKTLPTVPGGALFFTPSYWIKDAIIKRWRQNGIYNQINSIKSIVEEVSDKKAPQIFAKFKSYRFGALLIGVCRGKISEGIDFSDDLARIVYAFGIPYPGLKDPDIELKMKYNDQRHSIQERYMPGNDWYTGQAFRALFQSIGRCLRHTNDYGAIVFLDDRIESNLDKLPIWLKHNISVGLTPEDAALKLREFFANMNAKFPNHKLNSFNSNSLNEELFDNDEELDQQAYLNYRSQNSNKSGKSQSFSKYDQNKANASSTYKKQFGTSNYDQKPNLLTNYFPSNQYNSIDQKPFLPPNQYNSIDQKPFLPPNQYNSIDQKPFLPPNQCNPIDQKPFLPPNQYNPIDQKPFLPPNQYNPIDQKPFLSTNQYNSIDQKPFLSTNQFKLDNSIDQKPYLQKDFKPHLSKQPVIVLDEEEDQFEDYIEENAKVETKYEKKDNPFYTTLYCSNCNHQVIRLRSLQNVDFIKIPIREFFRNIDVKESMVTAMSVMIDNIVEKSTNSAETIDSSQQCQCKFLRENCAGCGQQVAAHILTTDNHSFKQYQTLLCKEILSMNFKGKLTPLKDI